MSRATIAECRVVSDDKRSCSSFTLIDRVQFLNRSRRQERRNRSNVDLERSRHRRCGQFLLHAVVGIADFGVNVVSVTDVVFRMPADQVTLLRDHQIVDRRIVVIVCANACPRLTLICEERIVEDQPGSERRGGRGFARILRVAVIVEIDRLPHRCGARRIDTALRRRRGTELLKHTVAFNAAAFPADREVRE